MWFKIINAKWHNFIWKHQAHGNLRVYTTLHNVSVHVRLLHDCTWQEYCNLQSQLTFDLMGHLDNQFRFSSDKMWCMVKCLLLSVHDMMARYVSTSTKTFIPHSCCHIHSPYEPCVKKMRSGTAATGGVWWPMIKYADIKHFPTSKQSLVFRLQAAAAAGVFVWVRCEDQHHSKHGAWWHDINTTHYIDTATVSSVLHCNH